MFEGCTAAEDSELPTTGADITPQVPEQSGGLEETIEGLKGTTEGMEDTMERSDQTTEQTEFITERPELPTTSKCISTKRTRYLSL